MLSHIDEDFLLSLKNEFTPNSSSTIASSDLLPSYSPIETLTSELDCLPTISHGKIFFLCLIIFVFLLLDLSFQSTIPTHFDMKNPDDWVLAYSLIKNSVVQLERTTNEDLLHLTNNHRNKLSINSPTSNIIIEDMPRVRGPKSTRFTCPICGLITVSMERLQRHVNQHGQKLRLETYKPERKVSSLICEKCKATFSSAYALRKHQRVHTRGLFIKNLKYHKTESFFIN
jgi:hypothetical protein